MTQRERILAAAKDIDGLKEAYSCLALIDHRGGAAEYEELFIPYPATSTSFAGQLEALFDWQGRRQWRVLALCFYAAMQEE